MRRARKRDHASSLLNYVLKVQLYPDDLFLRRCIPKERKRKEDSPKEDKSDKQKRSSKKDEAPHHSITMHAYSGGLQSLAAQSSTAYKRKASDVSSDDDDVAFIDAVKPKDKEPAVKRQPTIVHIDEDDNDDGEQT